MIGHRKSSLASIVALTALAAGVDAFGGLGSGPSGQHVRNDPRREKTPEDLARLAKAEEKRRRKAAKRATQPEQEGGEG